MSNLNKVILIGRIGSIKKNHTKSGDLVVNVSLATNEYYTDKNNEKQKITEWHNLVFYRNLAKVVDKFLDTGNSIYIEGSIRTNNYINKNGDKVDRKDIICSDMRMLD